MARPERLAWLKRRLPHTAGLVCAVRTKDSGVWPLTKLVWDYEPGGGLLPEPQFLATINKGGAKVCFFSDKSASEAVRLLTTCELIRWEKEILFQAIDEGLSAVLTQAAAEKGGHAKLLSPCNTFMLQDRQRLVDGLSAERFRQRKAKVEVLPLPETAAGLVLEHWPYKSEASERIIRSHLQCAAPASCGAFVDGELVAWAVVQENGAIGMLHTLQDHRRQGHSPTLRTTC